MSNDDLQKAIDEITKGENVDAGAETGAKANDAGTASVPLPNEMTGDATVTAEPSLNFAETPDSATGTKADMFGQPPVPDTSSAMPEGFDNPAVSATPDVPEAESKDTDVAVDPLAGFDAGASQAPAGSTNEPTETANFSVPTTTSEVLPGAENGSVGIADVADQGMPTFEPAPVVSGGVGVPDLEAVKIEALKELYPLLPKMKINPRQKFEICMNVIEKTGDKGASSQALEAAKQIGDEAERGECLLKLVEVLKG